MSSFIHTHSLISDCQLGFRPGSYIQEALLYISHDWPKPFDKRVSTAVIFFDRSNAFDHVSHSLLLFYLHKIVITGLLYRLFKDYHSGRKQYVVLTGHTSSPQGVSSGVPQGSIFGPLLFTIYMNGLFKVFLMNGTKLVFNTDDIVLYKPLTAARHFCYF